MTNTILLVDDDAAVREALSQTLELEGLTCIPARAVVEARDHITADFDGVILSDIRMPGKDGFALLDLARQIDPDLPVILLTGEGDIPMAVRGMSQGAFDFLEKPCATRDLIAILRRALSRRETVLSDRARRAALERGDAAARMLFGHSPQAETLRSDVRRAAADDGHILVLGPPGSGTPKVAEVVHLLSPRADRPFVKRAARDLGREGLAAALGAAAEGTLYLDEGASLSADAQLALHDALEGVATARVILGTTQPAAIEGGLTPDLYYQLATRQIRIPSLAERPADIPILFRHYVAQACEQAAIEVPPLSEALLSDLMAQDWPGNARALMSAAMRFVLSGPGDQDGQDELGLTDRMRLVEHSLIEAALRRHNGRARDAAEALKLPRKTFYDKLTKHGLRPEDYRTEPT